jgi:GNAT superfamily N-acetyltransferase
VTNVRPARADDLPAMWAIWYDAEVADDADPPPRLGAVPPFLAHQLESGHMYVAEQEGRVVGFISLLSRDGVCYIAEFFVRPDCQSANIGQTLLNRVLSQHGPTICTFSSLDFRALSLYVRAGLRPLWPNFELRIRSADLGMLPKPT